MGRILKLNIKMKTGKRIKKIVLYIALLIIMIYITFPFLWTLKSSFQTNRELIVATPNLIPHDPWWINYVELITGGAIRSPESISAYTTVPLFTRWLPRAMVNTMIVAGGVTAIALLVGSLAAYSIARLNFRGGDSLLVMYLATRMIPGIAIIIPIFLVTRQIGLVDTLLGLIIVDTAIVLPYAVWILKEYFETLPRDLEDAARIDGCSRIGVLVRIIWPLSAPGLVATGIFVFMMVWNMFLAALILTHTVNAIQITNIAAMFVSELHVEYGLLNTAAILLSLPPVILAFIFQKYIIQGLMSGAVKG